MTLHSPLLAMNPTLRWLQRAADDPTVRHPKRLPDTLDLREHAELFLRVFHAAPAGTEIGFPMVLRDGFLHFPQELASHSRYDPYLDGGRFIGTFHVHPPDRAPFFDANDLANTLRSDNSGFVELLLARDRLYALVRANPYLYISAHHVTRNPLLLAEEHAGRLRRLGARADDPKYAEQYRKTSLYYFQQYQLALYEGRPDEPLKRTVTPEGNW